MPIWGDVRGSEDLGFAQFWRGQIEHYMMAHVIEVPHMTVSIFASVNGGLVNSPDYEVEATPPP